MSKTKLTYREAALRALREAGRPLTTRELVDFAVASGLVPRSKTPEATMRTMLYRIVQGDHDFKKLGDHGTLRAKRGTVRWALKSWPAGDLVIDLLVRNSGSSYAHREVTLHNGTAYRMSTCHIAPCLGCRRLVSHSRLSTPPTREDAVAAFRFRDPDLTPTT